MLQACLERYIKEDIQTQTTSKYAFSINLIEITVTSILHDKDMYIIT